MKSIRNKRDDTVRYITKYHKSLESSILGKVVKEKPPLIEKASVSERID